MKRSSEAPVLVALVALMLTATVGVFTSSRTQDEFGHLATIGRSVQQWLLSHRIGQGLRQHFSVTDGQPDKYGQGPAAGSARPYGAASGGTAGSERAAGSPAAAPASTSSVMADSEDMGRLSGIAQRLVHSLRPKDWKLLSEALATPDEREAEQVFAQVLGSRLAPEDAQWIRSHFHGRTAFDAEDVRLLRAAFSEMKQELTPEEQRMLLAQLGSWLSN
ncbi:hypothetical protein [Alicyclobacillus kakegawensis]|uniref:hypothetical protein n=1 Tax=Alicyclobacillus kakegawensis TaxID=392012 RepID=UPI000831A299|nr:hypothetical protein [Alicyclobacillus kakegawensis]